MLQSARLLTLSSPSKKQNAPLLLHSSPAPHSLWRFKLPFPNLLGQHSKAQRTHTRTHIQYTTQHTHTLTQAHHAHEYENAYTLTYTHPLKHTQQPPPLYCILYCSRRKTYFLDGQTQYSRDKWRHDLCFVEQPKKQICKLTCVGFCVCLLW